MMQTTLLNTGHKLSVSKTLIRRPGLQINVLTAEYSTTLSVRYWSVKPENEKEI